MSSISLEWVEGKRYRIEVSVLENRVESNPIIAPMSKEGCQDIAPLWRAPINTLCRLLCHGRRRTLAGCLGAYWISNNNRGKHIFIHRSQSCGKVPHISFVVMEKAPKKLDKALSHSALTRHQPNESFFFLLWAIFNVIVNVDTALWFPIHCGSVSSSHDTLHLPRESQSKKNKEEEEKSWQKFFLLLLFTMLARKRKNIAGSWLQHNVSSSYDLISQIADVPCCVGSEWVFHHSRETSESSFQRPHNGKAP